jgi:hypothetical protein
MEPPCWLLRGRWGEYVEDILIKTFLARSQEQQLFVAINQSRKSANLVTKPQEAKMA